MDDTIKRINEQIERQSRIKTMEELGSMTLMAVREHGKPYSMGGSMMASPVHGQPYGSLFGGMGGRTGLGSSIGSGMGGGMVTKNPDLFTKMAVPEHGQPFFQPNTIVRPSGLEHEPYMNYISSKYKNTTNTNSGNYSVVGPRSDITNKEVRQLKPETDLLWSASGEIINTTNGKREPNFLNTSIGNYSTVTTDDGKSFYSNTPVSTGPGMKGTTVENGLGGPITEGFGLSLAQQGPITEGFSGTKLPNIVDFPQIPKPGKILTRMAIPEHGRPFNHL